MAALAQQVRAPEDGAIVTFDGFVRNQSHNRATLYLDYEAYESMAVAKMREIGAPTSRKYRIHASPSPTGWAARIGETSVFIAVSAPHRAAAFDACRFATTPQAHRAHLEKEYFADGAVWLTGNCRPTPAATPRSESAS